ncbi:MarR family winged helix-turn-helix transcriptional regulator [Clostridium sp. Marseille-P299]|uniref:MarR family winged helix-turn-helix transcriptional regulator n=1 Tax=Clostridium sp. Marseille-P299 TaxID=1805477 RepID=UPI0008302102|nr:MarR family transcriptional regulator [Clostridium sp. Marseille-P299]
MQSDLNDLKYIMNRLRTLTCQIKLFKNITFGEYTMLCAIGKMIEGNQESRLTPTKLNDFFGTKKPATSRMLTVLEKKGYITRKVDTNDHRIAYLMLTDIGQVVLRDETEPYRELTKRIAERMGKEELADMISTMTKFSRILEEELGTLSN